jgi:MFS transporter, ceroid-lipofuscinosis neuronal protein 7
MLIARFFVGVSAANVVICRSYLSAATTLSERTKAVSILTLAQTLGNMEMKNLREVTPNLCRFLGFIFGPSLQGAFTPLGSQGFVFMKIFHINMYTAPGWVNVFLGLINFILFLPFVFQDRRVAAREQMLIHGKETEKETWKSIRPDYLSSFALIFSLFVFVFNFVLLESLATPLTMEQFAWTKSEALKNMAILMTIGGAIACATFLLITPLCKMFKENQVLIVGGFFLMVLGRVAHIPYGNEFAKLSVDREFSFPNGTIGSFDEDDPKVLGCPSSQEWCKTTPVLGLPQFIIGYLLTSVGYPIGLTLIQTIFSKILGPRPQGVWMGLMTASGCLSRIFGPICVSVLYARYGTFWLSTVTGLMMIFPMVWLILLKDRLLIESKEAKSVEMQNLNVKEKEAVIIEKGSR